MESVHGREHIKGSDDKAKIAIKDTASHWRQQLQAEGKLHKAKGKASRAALHFFSALRPARGNPGVGRE